MPSPFTVPFELSAHSGRVWASHIDPSLPAAEPVELRFKGANWAGFQADGCPHHIQWFTTDEHIARLTQLDMNLVRLPLAAPLVAADSWVVDSWCCGEFQNTETLERVISRMRSSHIQVATRGDYSNC